MRHGCTGRAEGEGWAQHSVAGADALRHQHHQQRIGAAGAAHGILGATEGRELGFELRDLGTAEKLAMHEHPRDRVVYDIRGEHVVAAPGQLLGQQPDRARRFERRPVAPPRQRSS